MLSLLNDLMLFFGYCGLFQLILVFMSVICRPFLKRWIDECDSGAIFSSNRPTKSQVYSELIPSQYASSDQEHRCECNNSRSRAVVPAHLLLL